MASLLFLTCDCSGNQVPEIGLAQSLRKRGHNITFAGYESQRERFAIQGFPFLLLRQSAAALQREPLSFVANVNASSDHVQDVLELHQQKIDLMIVDFVLFGALAAAEKYRLPTVVMFHTAPGLVKSSFSTAEERLLDRINPLRASIGLQTVESIWELFLPFPTLCASLPELDPFFDQMPLMFAYVGPIFEEWPWLEWQSPWPPDDDRPLILVSFSAFAVFDQRSHITRTLEALASEPYRVLVTSTITNVSDMSVPENACIIPFMPHTQILPQTSAVVTHAGHGTVCAALAHGKPLVCLPNMKHQFDQHSLASQIQAIGAGIALNELSATPVEIRRSVATILQEHTYREAAQLLLQIIMQAAPPSKAVAMIEHLLEGVDKDISTLD